MNTNDNFIFVGAVPAQRLTSVVAAVEVYYNAVVYTPVNYCLWILFSAIVVAIAGSLVYIWFTRRAKAKLHRRQELLNRRRNAVQYSIPLA